MVYTLWFAYLIVHSPLRDGDHLLTYLLPRHKLSSTYCCRSLHPDDGEVYLLSAATVAGGRRLHVLAMSAAESTLAFKDSSNQSNRTSGSASLVGCRKALLLLQLAAAAV